MHFGQKSICKILNHTKLIRPIRLASLNSIWNDFVVRDNLPRALRSKHNE